MKHVVITGGSKGIGKALALEFLKSGCSVCITGRQASSLDNTVGILVHESGSKDLAGFVCDVTRLEDIRNLWNFASAIRPVDIWINNAGISHMQQPFPELDEVLISSVLDTNITGTVMGTRIAVKGMLKQGGGYVYNMEGFGSKGRTMNGMSIYGTSKNAITYFTRAIISEFRDYPVNIGSISPGMVVTDMLLEPLRLEPEKYRNALKVFHTLADPVERISPWIVRKILDNNKHGVRIAWLTSRKIAFRFLMSMFKKRNVKGLPGL